MSYEAISLAIGSHTWTPENKEVDGLLEVMRNHNIKVIDTARSYVCQFASFYSLLDTYTNSSFRALAHLRLLSGSRS